MIKPFSINIQQKDLDDLKAKLNATRWPESFEAEAWSMGADLPYMKEIVAYWANSFHWRKTEDEINSYPNYMADVDGVTIHFIHVKGNGLHSVPLLLTHGWPGSFLEMVKIIPLLTNGPGLTFDLVIPSIPGFGFSGHPFIQGCNSDYVAELWYKLMAALGYKRYGAQGGDIGAGISSWLALHHPENMIGLHLNYIPGSYRPYIPEEEKPDDELLAFQKMAPEWSAREGAYASMHATKPLTAAYGLNDSPVGLCAWILEKFRGWSDCNGHIENAFTKDELLGNISLYWLTQTIYSSMRIYNENSKHPFKLNEDEFIKVPVAFAKFPKELPTPPRSHMERGFNIQRFTAMPRGGHFAAAEQPVLLANDIRQFFEGLI